MAEDAIAQLRNKTGQTSECNLAESTVLEEATVPAFDSSKITDPSQGLLSALNEEDSSVVCSQDEVDELRRKISGGPVSASIREDSPNNSPTTVEVSIKIKGQYIPDVIFRDRKSTMKGQQVPEAISKEEMLDHDVYDYGEEFEKNLNMAGIHSSLSSKSDFSR